MRCNNIKLYIDNVYMICIWCGYWFHLTWIVVISEAVMADEFKSWDFDGSIAMIFHRDEDPAIACYSNYFYIH